MTTLPQYLTEQTEQAIRQRMLAALPADWSTDEGGSVWTILAPAAIELALAAIYAQEVLRRGFASTAFGSWLDLRADEHGLSRRAAVAATGTLRFTGTPGTVVAIGTRASTPSTESVPAVVVETTAEGTVAEGGTVDVAAQAVQAGRAGNVGAGTLTLLSSPLAGISAVTNPDPTTGGLDQETDAELLARYLQRVRNPAAGGNVADYQTWAWETAGVGGVSVVPLADGPGTVSIYLIDTDHQPAGPAVVDAVQQDIDPDPGLGAGKAPVGAAVTVAAAAAVEIDVSATLTVADGYDAEAVKAEVELAIAAYIESLPFGGAHYVRYVKIGAAIIDTPGVTNYADLEVNVGTADVAIDLDEVAITGTVLLT